MQMFVAIPTYKRFKLLSSLVHDLIGEVRSCNYEVSIYVYDNDIEMSAAEIKKIYPIVNYVSFPIKGLSNIRNKIIDDYKNSVSSHLLMIDDDQSIEIGFLNVIFSSTWINNFDVISANIRPKFLLDRPEWTYNNPVYWDSNKRTYGKVTQIYGAGCVVFGKKLKQTSLRFRTEFNNIGGEDTAFFYEILKEGFTFYVAKELLSNEIVGPERSTFKWFFKRCLRIGVSEFLIIRFFKSSNIIYSTMKSFIIVTCLFPVFIAGVLFKTSSMNKFLVPFLRHVGRIMASLGFVKDVY